MTKQLTVMSAVLALLIAATPLAVAQQPSGKSDMSDMPGMKPGSTAPHGQDMATMMKQCAAMRQQMKPGAAMSADMQKTMAQCDEMDRSMTAPEQPYVPPAQRKR
jgi:hypothetical protein